MTCMRTRLPGRPPVSASRLRLPARTGSSAPNQGTSPPEWSASSSASPNRTDVKGGMRCAVSPRRTAATDRVDGSRNKMSQVELSVPSISCGHCERTIVGALKPVPGVREVSVDIPARKVRLDYDDEQVNLEQIEAILAEEDY